ncbi:MULTISPECIES: hypothetical protein [Kitasatospora]|uniref:Lipopolysaccharide assembly protein A domain-containing protein n=1 Tax=Kitasatospora setae (strain ATCC 33774 / DSM 43861 / JCM 3304 / KCC A-0304 / NBRC 14216 / KM-6054) TaxID=452652 RepID=E4N5U0_KITSK|nr:MULTISPECIES: hypothetical protein [Kitasatospora]BAJ26571.1 hypothetical protein KSE_07310 [Kitasatospora setae KM-6054]
MLLLGLLLFAATGAFAGLLIADNLGGGPETGVTVLGHQIATVSTLGAFLAGLALALLFCAGLALMGGGLRWHRRHRRAAATAPEGDPVVLDRTTDPAAPTDAPAADRPAANQPPTARPTSGRPRHRFTH